jgi:hypothetical protein
MRLGMGAIRVLGAGITAIWMIGFVGISGCGTTEPAEPVPLGAIVQGISWIATDYSAERTEEGGILINGYSSLEIEITLDLIADTVGVYPVGTGLSSAILIDEGARYTPQGITAGSVTLTSVEDDRITGYFGFTAKLEGNAGVLRDVTNGTFSLSLSAE